MPSEKKVVCICGMRIGIDRIEKHKLSAKHLQKMAEREPDITFLEEEVTICFTCPGICKHKIKSNIKNDRLD